MPEMEESGRRRREPRNWMRGEARRQRAEIDARGEGCRHHARGADVAASGAVGRVTS